jgi:3-hydroxy-9,10-secoandrosta-1,3,5(10)-triene-9,17-dione monooxygenase reductase component
MEQKDTRALRNILGCFATGVAIITARGADNAHIGVTVNSFSSVSLDPPLILFSLARTAKVLAGFQRTESFAVNILGHGQEALSNMFARPSTASWDGVNFTVAENGCALLSSSLAHLECKKAAELEGGDHVILLGDVTRFHLKEAADPLLFYRGRYGTYARNQFSKLPPPDGSLSDFTVTGWG